MKPLEMATIMVLDDDQVVLDLLRTVLTDAGHTTLVASRFDAIPAGATADLVIIDLVPVKAYRRDAAVEWVSSLRSRFRGSPLFVVTAHAEAVAEPDMIGADAILAKPFDVDELLSKINELLADYIRKTP
jgi:DNA-binding response OmpR family regulator